MSSIQEEVAALQVPVENKQAEQVFIFLSFDLVNSTKLKSHSPTSWPMLYEAFYSFARKVIIEKLGDSAKVWKYIGDEVLFYIEVNSLEFLLTAPEKISHALTEVIGKIENYPREEKVTVSVKGTLWVAKCTYVPSMPREKVDAEKNNRNYQLDISSPESSEVQYDFLGPDIDAGFRISKYAYKSALALSFEYAYFLYTHRSNIAFLPKEEFEIESKMVLIDYYELKGIWNEREYPIIWYHHNVEQLKKNLPYDEHKKSELIKSLQERKLELSNINTIYQELGLQKITESIETTINAKKEEPTVRLQESVNREKMAEVHAACICFDSEGKFLAFKRPSSKKFLPSTWEFGCSQMSLNETFEDSMRKAYLEDFGIEIEVFPKPLTTYILQKGERIIPGLIFSGRISKDNRNNLKLSTHEEYRFFDPSEKSPFTDMVVDNFFENAQVAYDYFLSMK